MRLNRRYLIAGAIIVLFGIAFFLTLPAPEPVYGGRSLRDWIGQYRQSLWSINGALQPGTQSNLNANYEASNAIVHIGSDAIPTLLSMASARDSSLKRFVMKKISQRTAQRLGYGDSFRRYSNRSVQDPRAARWGFEVLGPSAGAAVYSLGRIGPAARDALPDLVRDLRHADSNTNSPRDATADAIYLIAYQDRKWQPDCLKILMPCLIEGLNDPAADKMRLIAMLQKIGPEAVSAVPALTPLLQSTDSEIRSATIDTLRSITPEAESKPRIK